MMLHIAQSVWCGFFYPTCITTSACAFGRVVSVGVKALIQAVLYSMPLATQACHSAKLKLLAYFQLQQEAVLAKKKGTKNPLHAQDQMPDRQLATS